MFYFTDRISSSVTSNAAGSHHSLPPSHGGFDQAESHTIVLSDSDTQDSIIHLVIQKLVITLKCKVRKLLHHYTMKI